MPLRIACSIAILALSGAHVDGRRARLECPLAVTMFSPTGRIAFDIPAAGANHFGTLIERNAAGVSTRGLNASDVGRHLRNDELPARRGELFQNGTEVDRPGAAGSWRVVWGYTTEATECMAGALVLPQVTRQHDYALTIPQTASIERVTLSRVDTVSGNEQVCGSWSGLRAVPATVACGSGADRAAFNTATHAEPATAAVSRGGVTIPPPLLQAAQGLRFGCALAAGAASACRVEIRWKPNRTH